MDSEAIVVEAPFTPDQIKRRKLADGNVSTENSPSSTVENTQNNVNMSKELNNVDTNNQSYDLADDSSKRYPNPDAPVQSLQDVMNSISTSRVARKDSMATATIDPLTNRIQLLTTTNNKANLKHLYGYDDGQRNTYLNPEEALYLMETGRLQICIDYIPISIVKARALFLSGSSPCLSTKRYYDGTTCTDEEYAVFKYLLGYGYRLRRCNPPSDPIIQPVNETNENQDKSNDLKEKTNVMELQDVEMKTNCDGTEEEVVVATDKMLEGESEVECVPSSSLSSNSQNRGLKRKRDIDPLSLNTPEPLDVELNDVSLLSPKVDNIQIEVEGVSSTSSMNVQDDTEARGDVVLASVIDSSPQSPEITIYDDEGILEDENMELKDNSNKIDNSVLEEERVGCGRSLEPIFEIGIDDDSSSSSSSEYSGIDDEPIPSTSKGLSNDPYTVVEVDSDVEFIDEVIFSNAQVDIQEVGTYSFYYDPSEMDEEEPDVEEEEEDDDYYNEKEKIYTNMEPCPSTSATPTTPGKVQLVDLVSSDEEEEEPVEEIAIKKFATDIWSKFVPNSVIQLGFPPASLLPKEIHRETTTTNTYEFNMKDQGDQSDLELEKFVDELKIDGESQELSSSSNNNVSSTTSASAASPLKNWKEWRQHFVKEAHDTFNSSLLGGLGYQSESDGQTFSEDVMEKLNLWQKGPETEEKMELNNGNHHVNSNGIVDEEFTYYLYSPSDKKVNKAKLGTVVKPTHRILIARNAQLMPDLARIGQQGEESIPVMIAIVQDDHEVTFLTPDLTPITSLF